MFSYLRDWAKHFAALLKTKIEKAKRRRQWKVVRWTWSDVCIQQLDQRGGYEYRVTHVGRNRQGVVIDTREAYSKHGCVWRWVSDSARLSLDTEDMLEEAALRFDRLHSQP